MGFFLQFKSVFSRIIAVPLIDHLPRIIAPLDQNIYNNRLSRVIAPPPHPLATSSLFHPSPLKLKVEYLQKHGFCYSFFYDNVYVFHVFLYSWILTLKINQETKFGTLKKSMFS